MDVMEFKNLIYKYWFDKQAKEIYIVCSREKNLPQNAFIYHSDYQRMNNIADKDLVKETYAFLSRYYPDTKIKTMYSYEYRQEESFKHHNIVLLGGPATNSVFEEIFNDEKCPISYYSNVIFPPDTTLRNSKDKMLEHICKDCKYNTCVGGEFECKRSKNFCKTNGITTQNIVKNGKNKILKIPQQGNPIYHSQMKESRISDAAKKQMGTQDNSRMLLSSDYGMFATMKNFYRSSSKKIVFISGLHSLGALGAFKYFAPTDSERDTLKDISENYKNISNINNSCVDFVAFIKVEIVRKDSGFSLDINPEKLDTKDLYFFDSKNKNDDCEYKKKEYAMKTLDVIMEKCISVENNKNKIGHLRAKVDNIKKKVQEYLDKLDGECDPRVFDEIDKFSSRLDV